MKYRRVCKTCASPCNEWDHEDKRDCSCWTGRAHPAAIKELLIVTKGLLYWHRLNEIPEVQIRLKKAIFKIERQTKGEK